MLDVKLTTQVPITHGHLHQSAPNSLHISNISQQNTHN